MKNIDVINFKEAIELLGISKSTLYKLTHKKEIPYYKPNGKLIFFKREELMAWVFSTRVSSVREELEDFINSKNN